jgi:methionine-rich copper-binding protein CopC
MSTRTLLAAGGALVAVALGPPAAGAHTELESTSPRAGTAAPNTIRVVTATFAERIRSGTLVVVNADGKVVSVGQGGIAPKNHARLKATLQGKLPVGRYTARWTAVAQDLDHLHGSWSFRIRLPRS